MQCNAIEHTKLQNKKEPPCFFTRVQIIKPVSSKASGIINKE